MAFLLEKSLVCPVLIGRASYIVALEELLGAAASGKGYSVALRGEAGIGKSRLMEETRQLATRNGMVVCLGQSYEYQQDLPYALLLDLLRNLADSLPSGAFADMLAAIPPASAVALSRLVPEWAVSAAGPIAKQINELDQEKQLIFIGVSKIFSLLTMQKPLLLVFEDLHWCDETSLEFLLYLIRRIASQPSLILLTYRHDEVSERLGFFLAQLDRQRLATEISLSPLSPVETGQMLQAALGLPYLVRNEIINPIFDLTEGNPFFIEEVLRSLIGSGELRLVNGHLEWRSPGRLQIPRSVKDAVMRRYKELSPAASNLLNLAAVIGRRFNTNLLLYISGSEEILLIGYLKELVKAQLLKEEEREEFAFRHALTREAVYSELIGPERKNLHARIARGIEELYTGRTEEHLSELAYHFFQAGLWSNAYQYSVQVGEKARLMNTPGTVIKYCSQALEAAEKLNLTGQERLYRARGQAYEQKGIFEAALSDFTRLLELTRAAGANKDEWQGLLDLGFLWAGRNYEQAGIYFRQALALARQLDDPHLTAQSLNRIGNWHFNVGEVNEALQNHYQALAHFDQIGDKAGIAETHDLLGMALGNVNRMTEAIVHTYQAIDLLRELGKGRNLVSSLCLYALQIGGWQLITVMAPTAAGSDDLAMSCLKEALEIAQQVDWLAGQSYVLLCTSGYLLSKGQLGKGLECAREALQLSTEIEHRQWEAASLNALGISYLNILDYEDARNCLEKGLTIAYEINSAYWSGIITAYLARLYITLKEYDRAEAVLARYIPPEKVPENQMEHQVILSWAQLTLARGHPVLAWQIYRRVENTTDFSSGLKFSPWVLKIKGEILEALGRMEEALLTLEGAVDLARECSILPALRELHLARYRLYRKLNLSVATRREAEELRQVTRLLADTLNNEKLRGQYLSKTLTELPAEKPLSHRRVLQQEFSGLTTREREIAAEIGLGKSNREIATKLFLSERTVESHVSNILGKLGLNSRSQLAVWATEKKLSTS